MKKIVYGFMVLCTLIVCALSLKAASYKVAIVTKNERIENFENGYLTNRVNESKSDLANGKVVIDVTLHNSSSSEVIYVMDNGKSVKDIKDTLYAKVKSEALLVENAGLINSGVITTTDGETSYQPLDTKNISTSLDTIKDIAVSETIDGEILTSLNEAQNRFSNNVSNKTIVLFVSALPSDTTVLKQTIDELANKNFDLVAYNIGNIDEETFNNVFASATHLSGIDSISFSTRVIANKPSTIENVNAKISFDKVLTDNFEIKSYTSTKGNVTYNDADNLNYKELTVAPFSINPNEDVVISYTLEAKSNVDSSIISKTALRTARQIVLTGGLSAEYPSTTKIDEPCSPTIMITDETLPSNPYTGIYDYIIAGACMLAVALVTLVVLNNKNEFSRI